MKQQHLSTGTIMFVPVPDDAYDFIIRYSELHKFFVLCYKTKHRWNNYKKENWNWKVNFKYEPILLGDSKEIKEADLTNVIPTIICKDEPIYYKCFTKGYKGSTSALYAFQSLKESMQLPEGKHIVLFEAKK